MNYFVFWTFPFINSLYLTLIFAQNMKLRQPVEAAANLNFCPGLLQTNYNELLMFSTVWTFVLSSSWLQFMYSRVWMFTLAWTLRIIPPCTRPFAGFCQWGGKTCFLVSEILRGSEATERGEGVSPKAVRRIFSGGGARLAVLGEWYILWRSGATKPEGAKRPSGGRVCEGGDPDRHISIVTIISFICC